MSAPAKSPSLHAHDRHKAVKRDGASWAFEFLRRNEAFARLVSDGRGQRSTDHEKGFEVIQASNQALSEFGVLYCSRTDCSLDEATVFWSPAANADVIDARLAAAPPSDAGLNLLRLDGMSCEMALLKVSGAADQLLLKSGARQLQINVIEGDVCDANIAIIPEVSPARNIDRQLLNLRRLLHLYAAGDMPDSLYKPDGKSARLNEVLTALDGWLQKASMKQIAVALYGERIVNQDWAPEGGYLIERVRRSIRRGRFLMSQGYRQLLPS